MTTKKCKFCKIEFYPYMKQRVYCSLKCYKKQKSADDIAKWKIKRETRAIEGKPCKRCSKSFTAKYNNSQYCDECRDILNSNKKGKQVVENKKKILYCTSCACELDYTHTHKKYCDECKTERTKKKSTKKIEEEKIDSKWLTRGTIK